MFRSTTPNWSVSPRVVLRQSAQQLNDHRLKPANFLGCSDLGTLALWHFGTSATAAVFPLVKCLPGSGVLSAPVLEVLLGNLALPVSTAIPKLPPYVLTVT